jgi:hypothetical protein
MTIYCFKAHLELLNLYKIGNLQKPCNYHVIKFLVLLLIVIEKKQIGKTTFQITLDFLARIWKTLAMTRHSSDIVRC